MTGISEAVGQQSQLASALQAGLNAIDRNQAVVFTEYTKYILPLDGFIFWVATGTAITVSGSLHYSTDRMQEETETFGKNQVVFTAEQEVTVFNSISPTTIWVGTFEGLQFSFSSRSSLYQQAQLWHYVGDAVYPALASQLVDSSASLAALAPIVSNSLPIWLSQNSFAPVYPSFLVDDNIVPPYIAVHIEPDATEALQSFPLFGQPITGYSDAIGFFNIGNSEIGVSTLDFGTEVPDSGSAPLYEMASNQLMRDKVRLTLYGFNNQMALQFYASLIQYSANTDAFGFMNSPAIRDDKRVQTELSAIAQKKHIDIDASYYQTTAYAIAQRLILEASVSYSFP